MRFLPLLLFLAALGLVSCRNHTVGEALRDLRGEEFAKALEVGDSQIEVRYLPNLLSCLSRTSLPEETLLSEKLLDSLTRDCPLEALRFSLRLSPRFDTLPPTDFRNDPLYGNLSGSADYRKTLDEFLFGLKTKIWLEHDGRRYDLRDYHLSRNFGMSKSHTFSLLFDPIEALQGEKASVVTVVIEGLLPGQGRDKMQWKFPLKEKLRGHS